jgi:hypothetical protein
VGRSQSRPTRRWRVRGGRSAGPAAELPASRVEGRSGGRGVRGWCAPASRVEGRSGGWGVRGWCAPASRVEGRSGGRGVRGWCAPASWVGECSAVVVHPRDQIGAVRAAGRGRRGRDGSSSLSGLGSRVRTERGRQRAEVRADQRIPWDMRRSQLSTNKGACWHIDDCMADGLRTPRVSGDARTMLKPGPRETGGVMPGGWGPSRFLHGRSRLVDVGGCSPRGPTTPGS